MKYLLGYLAFLVHVVLGGVFVSMGDRFAVTIGAGFFTLGGYIIGAMTEYRIQTRRMREKK